MNIKNETKRKKKERPQRSACYGRRKHKSFVESKHIFWKKGTDAKSFFLYVKEKMCIEVFCVCK